MNTKLLIDYLKDEGTHRCMWGFSTVDTSFDTMPSEFIDFAESDLQSELSHRYINALSNAKRALDCQADRLLKVFGYYPESQKKFWGFPKKVETIQKFDIIAPRVLNKINKTRNLMEHQYVKPNNEQVEDFLDIVSLFIASTEHHASNTLIDVTYENEDNDNFSEISTLDLIIDTLNSKLCLKVRQSHPDPKAIMIELNKDDENYTNVFKIHLSKIEFR